MKWLLALALCALPSLALAQGCGSTNPNCVVPTAPPGTSNNQAASTAFVTNPIMHSLQLSGTNTYSGVAGPGVVPFTSEWVLHGVPLNDIDGRVSQHKIWIQGDDMDVDYAYAFSVVQALSANHTGGRSAIAGQVAVNGSPAVISGNQAYVAGDFITSISKNQGGTGGPSIANWLGGAFGINPNVFTFGNPGATFLGGILTSEFDMTLATGSSAGSKTHLLLSLGGSDAVRGNFEDASIIFSGQGVVDPSVSSWLNGITFGSTLHRWPFYTDSTLINAVKVTQGPLTGNTLFAKYGMDLSQVTFTQAGGAPLRMPLMTPATSTEACSIGSMRWDASFIYVCTATNTWKRATLAAF